MQNAVYSRKKRYATEAESGLRDAVTDDLDVSEAVSYIHDAQDMIAENRLMQNVVEEMAIVGVSN